MGASRQGRAVAPKRDGCKVDNLRLEAEESDSGSTDLQFAYDSCPSKEQSVGAYMHAMWVILPGNTSGKIREALAYDWQSVH